METDDPNAIDIAALKSQQVQPQEAQSQAQAQNTPMVIACQNCATTITPLWRRDEHGQTICNACGRFLSAAWKQTFKLTPWQDFITSFMGYIDLSQ